jgi:hypothetical protein
MAYKSYNSKLLRMNDKTAEKGEITIMDGHTIFKNAISGYHLLLNVIALSCFGDKSRKILQ